jgi:multicomponent Na+:H+ antiporter subunit D
MRTGVYPPELRLVNLDSDWLYRRLAPRLVAGAGALLAMAGAALAAWGRPLAGGLRNLVERHHGLEGVLARTWSTGGMALWVALMLAGYLIAYYL